MAIKVIWQPEGFLNELKATLGEKLEETAEVVEIHASNDCPVDTGRLQESIDKRVDKEELTCTIGTDVEYAPYIEFGHKIKNSTKTVPPNPFLRSAIDKSVELIRIIFSSK